MNLPLLAMTRDPDAANRPSTFRAPPLPAVIPQSRYVRPSDLDEAISQLRRELSRSLSRPNGITLSRDQAEALLNAVEAK